MLVEVIAPRRHRKGCKTYRLECPACGRSRDVICTPAYVAKAHNCRWCAQKKHWADVRLKKALAKLPRMDSRPLWIRAMAQRLPAELIPATVNSRGVLVGLARDDDLRTPGSVAPLAGGFLCAGRL